MEDIKIRKEVKYLESIDKWCIGLWCKEYGIWTGGYFHKKLEVAEREAFAALKKSIDYKRECAKPTEKQDLVLNY